MFDKMQKVFSVFFFSCVCFIVNAQNDTLYFDGTEESISINKYISYYGSDADESMDSVKRLFQKGGSDVQKKLPINFGSVNGFFWFSVVIKNVSGKDQDIFIDIKAPHIYQVYFYQANEQPSLLYKAGLYFPFRLRPAPVKYFAFPFTIKQGSSYTAIIQIHHINSLILPVYVETSRELLTSNYKESLGWGFWSGFISFCFLLALIAWVLIKRSVFVWYSLYMLSVVFYGLTEQGYSFQFLFPEHPEISAIAIVDAGLLPFMFMIKFTQSLLETKKYLKPSHVIINWVFGFLSVMMVLGFAIPDVMFKISPILLPLVNLIVLFSLGLLAFIGVRSLKTNRPVAVFYLTAYGILVVCSAIAILTFAFGVFNYFGPNPALFGYLFEAILLSIAIALFFQRINNERLQLSTKVASQQKEMYQHYIAGIEKERIRIAGELHDDVGSRLSFLKRLFHSGRDTSSVADQLDLLIHDVRQLSHELAPPMIQVSGLTPLLEKLISDQRQSTGIDIRFQSHNFHDELEPDQVQQVYRIVQEALNNVIQHAQASHAYIQIFGHPKSFDIVIEDNGRGFEVQKNEGIGLNQMKIRTETLGGRIEINSYPEKGTTLLIQIPIN